ncbi:MAG: hypothetical protein NZ937_06390 [Armatimonadetes bacterium]|nr:hypothetical protein [Armatimonadota bacterium]
MKVSQITEVISGKGKSVSVLKEIITEEFIIELFWEIDDQIGG